jgi:hypothetical protein
MRSKPLFTSLLLGLSALTACNNPGVPPPGDSGGSDGGGSDGGSTTHDAGSGSTSLTYIPTGCTDLVVTPTVIDAQRGSDVFGATPTTDHVHVSWAGPTDSTLAIMWRSDHDTLASSVLIGTDQAAVMAASDATSTVTRHDGHAMLYSGTAGATQAERVHEVHVCGLTSGTTYYYRVGGTGHWSEVFSASTGPAVGSSTMWSFGVTGDSRGNDLTTGPGDNAFAIAQHHLSDRGVDFEVFTGDAVFLGSSQPLWNLWFDGTDGTFGVQDFLAHHPLMMSNGNHDLLVVNYLVQFALPQDVSTGENADGEEWYSFDYANAHFVVLNDTVMSASTIAGAEATWLESDLSAVDRTRTPWIFAVHHQALFTCGSTHAADTTARDAWQPIFDAHNVDFVLAGHNHVYERTLPILGSTTATGDVQAHGSMGEPTITGGVPSGTVYVVAGGAGAPLYPISTSACPATHTGVSERNYTTFSITGTSLHMTTRDTLTDAIIDEMTYTK